MEITKEALTTSLNDLKDLEKSHNAEDISEPLKKSDDTPNESETDLSKGGDMNKKYDHDDMKKKHDGESDHDYDERMKNMKKKYDHDNMKKGGDYDSDMKKMGGHKMDTGYSYNDMKKMGYSHPEMKKMHGETDDGYGVRMNTQQPFAYFGEKGQMEAESDYNYAIRMKNMANAGHEDQMMHNMAYSHATDENDTNSLVKSFQEDGELKKAIEVSDFLKSLVDKTTSHLSSVNDHLQTVDSRLEKSFSHLLETIQTQNKVIINQGEQIEGLQKSFNDVLNQPVGVPRSLGNSVVPVGRVPGDFSKSLNDQNPMLLKKSILRNMTKAVEAGDLHDIDLIKFETTGEISNDNLNRFGSQG